VNERAPLTTLTAVKDALWYDYLSGHFDYHFTCDMFEVLLGLKSQINKEKI